MAFGRRQYVIVFQTRTNSTREKHCGQRIINSKSHPRRAEGAQ